jgi:hypothetical protein
MWPLSSQRDHFRILVNTNEKRNLEVSQTVTPIKGVQSQSLKCILNPSRSHQSLGFVANIEDHQTYVQSHASFENSTGKGKLGYFHDRLKHVDNLNRRHGDCVFLLFSLLVYSTGRINCRRCLRRHQFVRARDWTDRHQKVRTLRRSKLQLRSVTILLHNCVIGCIRTYIIRMNPVNDMRQTSIMKLMLACTTHVGVTDVALYVISRMLREIILVSFLEKWNHGFSLGSELLLGLFKGRELTEDVNETYFSLPDLQLSPLQILIVVSEGPLPFFCRHLNPQIVGWAR